MDRPPVFFLPHTGVEAIQEYANITELDAATLNRLIKEIVVHERIDEDKTRSEEHTSELQSR